MVPRTKFSLTQTGVDELKTELKELTSRRQQIASNIKTAREFGDLGENAEYHAAREEQNQVESRIAEIEHILKNVKLINQPTKPGQVELLNTVVLKNGEGEKTVTIVGSVEADPTANKISDESPLGQALLGKKVGDKAEIKTPAGQTIYTIKSIK
jgi:transcription elongation factor GreA